MNGNGTNESGFSGLPGGLRYGNGILSYIGSYGFWWSSTEQSTGLAWCYRLDGGSNEGWVLREPEYMSKGFSVRCIKD